MSLDERMRAGVRTAAASHAIDTPTAWEEVRMQAQKQTRRNLVLVAAATAAVVVAGVVWGPGLLDSMGGETDTVPAGPQEDPAAVLAEYQEARNANLVSEDSVDPEEWVDSLMSFYAEDAVVTGHPLDDGDPPIATGLEEIRALEARIGPAYSGYAQRPAHATEFFDVEASGDQATFLRHFFNKYGECAGGTGLDKITVEDGKITNYDWGEGANEPCDPEQLAQTYVDGMSVEFTGDSCVYSGPTEFDVGDRFAITAVDTTEVPSKVGYAVGKVVDGTTVADAEAAAQGGEEAISRLFEDRGTYLWSERTEEERFMSATLDVAGTWLVYCFGGPGGQVYAGTFEVVE